MQLQIDRDPHSGTTMLSPEDLAVFVELLQEQLVLPPDEQVAHKHTIGTLLAEMGLPGHLIQDATQDVSQGVNTAEIQELRATEAAKLLDIRGYAEQAPEFEDQARDITRLGLFSYNNLPAHIDPVGWPIHQKTEVEGLMELDGFLEDFIALKTDTGEHPFPDDQKQARSILKDLTFIGEKEIQAAALGLSKLWKSYLDANPEATRCMATQISNSEKYPNQQKSDVYLRDQILAGFSKEERAQYSRRLVDSLEAIRDKSPKDVRIVLLDDWTITGQQLTRVYQEIAADPDYRKFLPSLEVNLVVASEKRIRYGFRDPMSHPSMQPIKLRAYYKAHEANATRKTDCHISGLHSTVNFDFGDSLEAMIKRLARHGVHLPMPALASIVRPYRLKQKAGEI